MNGTSEVVAKKYPKAMYFCGSVFSFTNFSYYGMKLVLLLFIAESTTKGGLGLSNGEATSLLASFMAFHIWMEIFSGVYVTQQTRNSAYDCSLCYWEWAV